MPIFGAPKPARVLLALVLCLGMLSAPVLAVSPIAQPIAGKLGQKLIVNLKAGQKQDYSLALPAGHFLVICDSRASGDERGLAASLALLQLNGAPLLGYSGPLAAWKRSERVWRDGQAFALSKPQLLRLRLRNTHSTSPTKFWLTIIPDEARFVPFGFGNEVMEGKTGAGNGVGGTIHHDVLEFQRLSLPVGRWRVILGAKAETARVYATLLALDARSFYDPKTPLAFELIAAADEVGSEKRVEKILTLNAPTTFIFRVWNRGAGDETAMSYDVTVEPIVN